jgi:hypothetical protein
MPETYGLPEDEPTRTEQAQLIANEVVAGQGIVRRVVLYALVAALAISPLHALAVVPLVLLMATDGGLE